MPLYYHQRQNNQVSLCNQFELQCSRVNDEKDAGGGKWNSRQVFGEKIQIIDKNMQFGVWTLYYNGLNIHKSDNIVPLHRIQVHGLHNHVHVGK